MRLTNQKCGLKDINGRFNSDNDKNGSATSQNGFLMDKKWDIENTMKIQPMTMRIQPRICNGTGSNAMFQRKQQCVNGSQLVLCPLSIPTVVAFQQSKERVSSWDIHLNNFCWFGTNPYPGTTGTTTNSGQQRLGGSSHLATGCCKHCKSHPLPLAFDCRPSHY